MKLEFSRQISEKYSNIKFHENLSSWSRVVPVGRTGRQEGGYDETDGRFHSFVNMPKNHSFFCDNCSSVKTMIVPVTEPLCESRDRFHVISLTHVIPSNRFVNYSSRVMAVHAR
jgi:hypothetical protein